MENKKYSVVYKNAESTSTWTYDLSKTCNGPVSVEIEYHDGLVECKVKGKEPKAKKAKAVKAKPTPVKKKKIVKKKSVKKKINTNLGRFV